VFVISTHGVRPAFIVDPTSGKPLVLPIGRHHVQATDDPWHGR
jgi:hypothetical protein